MQEATGLEERSGQQCPCCDGNGCIKCAHDGFMCYVDAILAKEEQPSPESRRRVIARYHQERFGSN